MLIYQRVCAMVKLDGIAPGQPSKKGQSFEINKGLYQFRNWQIMTVLVLFLFV